MPDSDHREAFWERVPLSAMTRREWESLCDGCGRCCLLKFQTCHDDPVTYTNVACRMLDTETCRCRNYPARRRIVPDCVRLNMARLEEAASWLPTSCAYRRLYEGKPLPDWHPLLTGDPDSVKAAGISMSGRAVPETEIDMDMLESYAIETA